MEQPPPAEFCPVKEEQNRLRSFVKEWNLLQDRILREIDLKWICEGMRTRQKMVWQCLFQLTTFLLENPWKCDLDAMSSVVRTGALWSPNFAWNRSRRFSVWKCWNFREMSVTRPAVHQCREVANRPRSLWRRPYLDAMTKFPWNWFEICEGMGTRQNGWQCPFQLTRYFWI